MRTPSSGRTGDERKPAGTSPAGRTAAARPGLQGSAGNAAVVQMLREAGHPWAQEEHRHGAGCGHRQEQGPEVPEVQRSAVHDVLRTPGRPLDDVTRADMEQRLGADFSDVRIHDDTAARTSAAEVGARAYTSGSHVVIGDGGADRHTLAHELTHVVQQRQGPVAGADNGAGLKVSDPSDRFEREAEATAREVMAGRPVQRRADTSYRPSGAPAVQRITYPENPGDMLKQSYWEEQAGGKKQLVNAKKDLKGLKKGNQRTLGDVVGGVANRLLVQLDSMPATSGVLRLYRGMSSGEADAVLAWAQAADGVESPRVRSENWIRQNPRGTAAGWREAGGQVIPVGTHLGDQKQADNYMEDGSRMLEFTLKPGAHRLLFDPEYTALAPEGDATAFINKAIPSANRVAANKNEGTFGGYIGIKAERHGYFSVNPGKSTQVGDGWKQTPGHLLFQMFVQSVRDVTGEYAANDLPSTRG
ncbi:eCIS core domain-containing protein [Streptomyces sp. NPDC004788]